MGHERVSDFTDGEDDALSGSMVFRGFCVEGAGNFDVAGLPRTRAHGHVQSRV